jgi:hypothetical protein
MHALRRRWPTLALDRTDACAAEPAAAEQARRACEGAAVRYDPAVPASRGPQAAAEEEARASCPLPASAGAASGRAPGPRPRSSHCAQCAAAANVAEVTAASRHRVSAQRQQQQRRRGRRQQHSGRTQNEHRSSFSLLVAALHAPRGRGAQWGVAATSTSTSTQQLQLHTSPAVTFHNFHTKTRGAISDIRVACRTR